MIDRIFGQLGNDQLHGDGQLNAALELEADADATTDGHDYIEGNGGSDVIFGGLGQDGHYRW